MKKEKMELEKHEIDDSSNRKNIEEEQIIVDELKKELKREVLDQGLFILAIYIFFGDID